MRQTIPALILLALSVIVTAQKPEELPKYESRYDYLDLDAILDNKRLVRNYVDCLLFLRPCSPEGKALKRILPEALRTKCARCTDRQRIKAINVIKRLKRDYPEDWEKLSNRWDPTGDFNKYFDQVVVKNETLFGSDATTSTSRPSVEIVNPDTNPQVDLSNRFGEDDDVGYPPANNDKQGSSIKPVVILPTSSRPYPIPSALPTEIFPTRFSIIPNPTPSLPPIYASTVTFIDHFGSKLIRTTELVADIMLNTVRAVLGR